MKLLVIDEHTSSVNSSTQHSIPDLTLKILNESVLMDGLPRFVCVFDDHNQLIGECSIILNHNIGFIGNVWIHDDYRNGVILFRMLKKLSEFANQHKVYDYEAHVRDYTMIKPNAYTGRIGLPLFEEHDIFYEYFIKPSFATSADYAHENIPSSKRSKIIKRFYNEHTSVIAEDYAHAYQSFDQNNHLINIGHITEWTFSKLDEGIATLQYVSQFYDYLTFKSLIPICEYFNVIKMYKTSVFKNRPLQNTIHKVAP